MQVAVISIRARTGGGPGAHGREDARPEAVRRAVAGWVDRSLSEPTDPGRVVYAAVDAQEVVGLISVGIREHFTGEVDAYVGELVVAEPTEGRGSGTSLVQAADSWATERGLMRLTLETGAANAGAKALYTPLDYIEEDVRLTKLFGG